MIWIEHREYEAIPDYLLYNGWKTNKDEEFGYTPLMCWIERRRNEAIPECLYYEGWQTDKDHSG